MRGTFWFVFAACLAAALASAPPAAAQENAITLHTDRSSYGADSVIAVWGSVSTLLPGAHIQMKILYGDQVIMVDQFEVAADRSFARLVTTGGPNWSNDGQYVVRVWYGSDNTSREFEYVAGSSMAAAQRAEVDDGRGGTFDVWYSVLGGTVDGMAVDYDNLAIRVEMSADSGGSLALDLPRAYINSTDAGGDVAYIVMAGDRQLYHEEVDAEPDVRRITVTFPADTTEILVVGTAVVPEFGAAAAVLLAVGGAAAAARLKTRISP